MYDQLKPVKRLVRKKELILNLIRIISHTVNIKKKGNCIEIIFILKIHEVVMLGFQRFMRWDQYILKEN